MVVCLSGGRRPRTSALLCSLSAGVGVQELESGADVQGLQADLLILCQVRQACFGGCFLSIGLHSSPGQDGLVAVHRSPGELMINVIVCNSDRGPLEPGCHTQLISPAVLSPFVCSPVIQLPVN